MPRRVGFCVCKLCFCQTYGLRQKQRFNSLRHQHSRSCAFDHSRKTERENIFTQVQLSATQAALRSTDEVTTLEPGLSFMIRDMEEVGRGVGGWGANRAEELCTQRVKLMAAVVGK